MSMQGESAYKPVLKRNDTSLHLDDVICILFLL
jgi:hypothetical protein